MNPVVYVDEQSMPRSDCMDANTDLDLWYSSKTQEPFLPCCGAYICLRTGETYFWIIIIYSFNTS